MLAASTSDDPTTRWVRLEPDVDDTIPVDLYSRPYERVEIQARRPRPQAPKVPAAVFAIWLTAAFLVGFALVVLIAQ
jgi:hypothetical protein